MKLIINLPFSEWLYKISGVYKITFSDGSFYIGCSNHLRGRASGWESIMLTEKGIAGKTIGTSVINKIKELDFAEFNIVELCHPKDLKGKEAFYLDKYKDNPLMLSMASCSWTPVLQYNADGLFIKKHNSMSSAAKYNNTSIGRIQDVLYGVRKTHRGMIFILEEQYKERRKKIVRARYKPRELKKGRNVVMINNDGEEVKQFKKIVDAAREINCTPMNIARVLNGFQKTAKGFAFRYA